MAIDQDIYLAADNIVTTKDGYMLLIRRGNPPFQGMRAFPGGFVETDEALVKAAARELEEETGLQLDEAQLELVATEGAVGRDPRFRTVSVVYHAELETRRPVKGADDAEDARWFLIDDLPPMAFDHYEILQRLGLV
jgi:8-oxo-dGTP diphosphatase